MAETKHLCMQCMQEIEQKENVCPYCGYAVNSVQSKLFLPQGIVLKGRYLTGKMIKRNVDSAVYIGYDIQNEKVIEIREFFPEKVSKRDTGNLQLVADDENREVFREYLQSFTQLWKNLMRFKGLPALMDVNDVFSAFSTSYAVTDHDDSTTFRKILDTVDIENNPMSCEKVRQLVFSILSTVESLHTANVVHRGISPETLVLSSDGNLKLTGFAIPQIRTTKNKIISSVYEGYAAIEQYDFNWQQGSWTDTYAIGALMYKLLTGRLIPSAPERLKNDEIFFTDEEKERLPGEIIALINDCLILMPQGRLKDVRDIINVIQPHESKSRILTARGKAYGVKPTGQTKTAEPSDISKPKQAEPLTKTTQPRSVKLTDNVSEASADGGSENTETALISVGKTPEKPRPIRLDAEIPEEVKPKQGEPQTKTTQPKAVTAPDEEEATLRDAEELKRRNEEKEEIRLREKEIRLREKEKASLEKKNRLREKLSSIESKYGDSAVIKKAKSTAQKGSALKSKMSAKRRKPKSPVLIGISVAALVAVSCTFIAVLLYSTVLYKVFDAPVLDNCLSAFEFLPLNSASSDENVIYVDVADFSNLTKEYIENDAIYSKRYTFVFEYDYCDTVAAGYVFDQSIEPGERVPKGSTVTVYVSKGIEQITVPPYKNLEYAQAEALLSEKGFKVLKNEMFNIGLYEPGIVVSASLKEGDTVPKGTEIILNVWGLPPLSSTETQSTEPYSGYQTEPPTQAEPQRGQWGIGGGLFSFFEDIFGF